MLEQDIKRIIEEFLSKTDLHFEHLAVDLDLESGSYWVSARSNDSRHLIGRDGEHLQMINHLLKRIFETKYKDAAPRIALDINNYKKDRIEKVKTVSHMMAERARFFKSKIELEPMNAFERLIVHEYVAKHADLSSESTGSGKERRVVISWKKED